MFGSEGFVPLGQHEEHREPWPSLLSVHCFALVQVHSYGGVLVEEDFSNYSVTVEDPMHTVYQGTPLPIAAPGESFLHLARGGNSTEQELKSKLC